MLELARCSVDLGHRRVITAAGEGSLTELEAALLGYLIAREGQDVSREELLSAVWGYAPSTTSRAVDSTVARLRGKLDEPQPPQHLLTVHGHGYRFVRAELSPTAPPPAPAQPRIGLASGELDLGRREIVAETGGRHALSKREAELLGLLAQHLGQLVPRERVIRHVWGRGAHEHALESLVQRIRRRLEPDPLHPRVLVTVRGEGLRLEPASPAFEARTDLVASDTPFEARAEADEVLAAPGIVTLLGTAGLGKTRLAKECALRWVLADPRAEARLCELAGVETRAGVVGAVAGLLGVSLEGVGEPEEHVGRALARRPALVLILDNFEQLLPAAPLLARWAALAPEARLVVTSRIALGLPGERVIALAPLELQAAARLYACRVPGADPADPEVRALVERLDRLPLALELAAARAARLGTGEVLRRIAERLDLLCRRPASAQTQHSSLRGALDCSWDLLSSEDKLALARGSVFVAPFAPAAAESVLGPGSSQRLASLAAQSLVRRDAAGRWSQLESVRDYAREKLALMELRAQAEADHADYFVAQPPRDEDMAEMLAAHARSGAHRVRLALVLHPLLVRQQDHATSVRLLREALEQGGSPAQVWELWSCLAACERDVGPPFGVPSAQIALALARELDPLTLARALHQLAACLLYAGRPSETEALMLEALGRFRALGDSVREARTLVVLAFVATALGREEQAQDWLAEHARLEEPTASVLVLQTMLLAREGEPGARACADRLREGDDPLLPLHRDGLMAEILGREGHLDAARALLLSNQEGYAAAGNGMRLTATLHWLAVWEALAGDLDAAWARVSHVRSPAPLDQQLTLATLRGLLLHLRGEPGRAVEELRQVLERSADLPVQRAYTGLHLAMALASCGQRDEARRVWSQARPQGVGPRVAARLERLARLTDAWLQDQPPPDLSGPFDPDLSLALQIYARCHNSTPGAGLL